MAIPLSAGSPASGVLEGPNPRLARTTPECWAADYTHLTRLAEGENCSHRHSHIVQVCIDSIDTPEGDLEPAGQCRHEAVGIGEGATNMRGGDDNQAR